MTAPEVKAPEVKAVAGACTRRNWLQIAFVRLGVLPFLLLIAVVVFTLLSDNFLTGRNIMNVLRQSTYLTMVAMGQMLALLTGGFDLSVGTMLALTSVVSAATMAGVYAAAPDMVALAIVAGVLAGLAAGLAIGVVNGIGVSLFNVSPFMMTLGMASVGFGAALYMTGGVPVYGMPDAFGNIFHFRQYFGIPAPVYVTAALVVVVAALWTWYLLASKRVNLTFRHKIPALAMRR